MKKKPSPAPQRSHIWKKIKDLDVWIFLVVIVALAIWVTHGLTALRHGRKLIEQDPVRTEAWIIEIGKAGRDGGPPVYYEYQVGDSTYQGKDFPWREEAKEMWVGQEIPIVYQRTDPSNSRIVHPDRE